LALRNLERTDANGARIQAGKSSQKTSLSQTTLEAALDRSGTSAKTGFRDLPVEVVQAIIREVAASGSAGDTAAGLHAIMLSNKFLNKSVLGEPSVKEHYDFLQPLIGAFKALKPQLAIHQINSHMLALMGPKQRQELVTAALGLPDSWNKAKAIVALGAGLGSLERPQALVAAALGLPETMKATAIVALGAGLGSLERSQQQALVAAALGLVDEGDKARAIAGLGVGLAALERSQQQALATTALDLARGLHKARAIAGLGAGLTALERLQQEALVTAALDLTDEWHKSMAIAGLGAGLAALERSQQQALVTAALGLTDDEQKARVIAVLCAR
jgi:hypothetical protein